MQPDPRPIATTPAPACPAWCTAGHSAALVPDAVDVYGSALFTHRAVVLADDPDGRRIDLVSTSYVRPDGQVEHEAPAVMIDGQLDVLPSAAQARRQAAALVLAAELAGGAR